VHRVGIIARLGVKTVIVHKPEVNQWREQMSSSYPGASVGFVRD
jgi:hypothetical protein